MLSKLAEFRYTKEKGDRALKILALDSNCGSAPTSCVILDNFFNLSDP